LSPAARFVACDPDLCVGCQICEFACAAVKGGGADILKSRIRVVRHEPSLMLSIACRGCASPACVRVCPQPGALAVNPDTQLIDVDNTICDGCGWCIDACPFGVALLDRIAGRVVICDLCGDRADGAACVEMCPKDALEIASPAMVADKANGGAVRALLDEIDVGRG
jgi:Fe-S-cluster-containing dehydrogenase component